MTGLTVFVLPFVYPYYRATVYSGDRIAYACCGDLDVSLHAVYRALVGKEIAPHLRADGLTGQALLARHRKLLRFAQLLRPTPHATNRYLNLLAFVRSHTPDAFEAHRPILGTAGQQAEPVLAGLSRRQDHRNAPAIGIGLAVLLLLGGLLTGVTVRNSPIARGLVDAYRGTSQQPSPTEDTGTASVSPTESSPPPTETTSPSSYAAELLALVPTSIQATCTDTSASATGTLAALTCNPTGDAPESLSPITRASGTKKVLLARYARNERLGDAIQQWAFGALKGSPGARAYYDALKARKSATTRPQLDKLKPGMSVALAHPEVRGDSAGGSDAELRGRARVGRRRRVLGRARVGQP
jgi:hypothetical protein